MQDLYGCDVMAFDPRYFLIQIFSICLHVPVALHRWRPMATEFFKVDINPSVLLDEQTN